MLWEFIKRFKNDKSKLFPEEEKHYNPYMINKIFSMHLPLVETVNFVNVYHKLPKKMHYDFYKLIINMFYPKLFIKYLKKDNIKDLEIIKEFFNVSNEKGEEILKILSADDLTKIKKQINLLKKLKA